MYLNLLVIRTERINELSKFYEKLGLKFEYHKHGKGQMHYSTKIGELVFEIYPLLKNQEKVDNSLRLGFKVENLDNLIGELREKGVEILKEPLINKWGYYSLIKDIDGRKIELIENYD